jgi:hypothetical protein
MQLEVNHEDLRKLADGIDKLATLLNEAAKAIRIMNDDKPDQVACMTGLAIHYTLFALHGYAHTVESKEEKEEFTKYARILEGMIDQIGKVAERRRRG